MGLERGVAVRPAGAPMVSVEPPPWAHADDGSTRATAGEAATEVVTEARQAAGQVAAEAKDAGRQMADDARRAANEQVDQRSTMAGERVGVAADDARSVAEHLRGRGREGPARLADDAAQRMEHFAEYLRDADSDRIMSDVRRVGRTHPAALVAGAAVVGIVVGRVVKASEPTGTNGGTR